MRLLTIEELAFIGGGDGSDADEPATGGGGSQAPAQTVVVTGNRSAETVCPSGFYPVQIVYSVPGPTTTMNTGGSASLTGPTVSINAGKTVSGQTVTVTCNAPVVTCNLPDGKGTITRPGGPDTCAPYTTPGGVRKAAN